MRTEKCFWIAKKRAAPCLPKIPSYPYVLFCHFLCPHYRGVQDRSNRAAFLQRGGTRMEVIQPGEIA